LHGTQQLLLFFSDPAFDVLRSEVDLSTGIFVGIERWCWMEKHFFRICFSENIELVLFGLGFHQ
jgi:hypothetical protein